MSFLSTLSLRRATFQLLHQVRHMQFLSTLSLRRATSVLWMARSRPLFLSTLSLRRATAIDVFLAVWAVISIHALLAESDPASITPTAGRRNFYPRSPCGERQINPASQTNLPDFYPRSPCGERHYIAIRPTFCDTISIHALLAESDTLGATPPAPPRHFYPRSPCGERQRQ